MKKIKKLDAIIEDDGWKTLLDLLPKGWEQKMLETKCFVRKRKIKQPGDFLRIILAYPVLSFSLPSLARWAEEMGIANISPISLWERMQNAVPFLLWLVGELVKPLAQWSNLDFTLAPLDATTFTLPTSKGRDWLLHMLWSGGHPINLRLSKAQGKGSGESLKHLSEIPENVVLEGDRIYATPPQIAEVTQQNRLYLLRFSWSNLPLYKNRDSAEKVDPRACLGDMKIGEIREFFAWLHPKNSQPIQVRVVAIKKDELATEAARRKNRKKSTHGGHTPRKISLFLAGFVTLVTNLGVESVSKEVVAESYRWRWQIELEFKRFKSTTQVRKLINHKDAAVQVYLLALLVVWLLAHRMAHENVFFPERPQLVSSYK